MEQSSASTASLSCKDATVEEVRGSVEGEVGDEDIPETEIVATVDPDVDGRLNWIIRVADGETNQTLPAPDTFACHTCWLANSCRETT